MVYHNVYVILNFLQTQSNNPKPTFIQIQFWKNGQFQIFFQKICILMKKCTKIINTFQSNSFIKKTTPSGQQ